MGKGKEIRHGYHGVLNETLVLLNGRLISLKEACHLLNLNKDEVFDWHEKFGLAETQKILSAKVIRPNTHGG